ncbi:MAG: peptidylprolyl isomerase [Chloroflexota bacterium]|nr:peptidylprolyl isomerase [Chloroflexota bacterium]
MPANPADRNGMYNAPPEMQIDSGKTYVATISTVKGDIVIRLDASAAPQTVNNFVFLAQQGFYDDLTFHRVEPGFVIQGGDPTGTGAGGPGYTVPAEIQLPHIEGVIAMARQSDQVNPTRASSGSQFYITLAPTPFLDGAYTAFGQVTTGMDVVQSITVGDVIERVVITE